MAEWFWTTNEENYPASHGPFGTREEAVAGAREEMTGPLLTGYRFWTGRKEQPGVDEFSVDPEWVLESVGEQAYELAGEAAEEWPTGGSLAATKDLGEKLSAVLRGWLLENDPPEFWIAVDAREHEA